MPHSSDEQPFDDRHTAPAYPATYPDPRTGMPSERFFGPLEPVVRRGLTWSDESGLVMADLGRIKRDRTQEMDTLDLRVLLAHLDSAAFAIKTELEER